MVDREIPPGVKGYIEKILSFDQYQGVNGRVSALSYKISELRREFGFPGDMDSDLEEAQNIIKNEVTEKVLAKQSPSLRTGRTSDIIPTYNMKVVVIDTSHD